MMINLDIRDEITPLVKRYLENNPRMLQSLAKSLGWFTQKEIKRLAVSKSITSQWHERVPYEIRKKLDKGAPVTWLGKLRRTFAYQFIPNSGGVNIGWASRSAAVIGRLQEEGASRTVTPALRGFFFSKGVPLSVNKGKIVLPARPIYEPVMKLIQPKIGPYVAYRVGKYIQNGGFVKNASKGRKYEVFR